jgi:hypothetical protein
VQRASEDDAWTVLTIEASVQLYWIPLGAGGHSVRFNGRVYEAIVAAKERRRRSDLYHAALVIAVDGAEFSIEVAPSPDADLTSRGVVGTGAVGSRWLGWLRLFRYELRCCRNGVIPDLAEAVGEPVRISTDPNVARRIIARTRSVPRPVWGRRESGTSEMWNSNSVVAWLLADAGIPMSNLTPPPHGRAPGWDAGRAVALREQRSPGEQSPDPRAPERGVSARRRLSGVGRHRPLRGD